jgi:hypothetical protein
MSYDPVGYRRAEPYGHQPYGRPEPPVIYGRPYRPAAAPPQSPPPRGRRWPYLLLGAALAVLAGAGWTAYDRNVFATDSGVRACEALRDQPSGYQRPMTEAEYRALRKTFEDSRYGDIRDHGTRLVDVAWQVSRLPDGDQGTGALRYAGPLTEHASGLQSACADRGIIVNLS